MNSFYGFYPEDFDICDNVDKAYLSLDYLTQLAKENARNNAHEIARRLDELKEELAPRVKKEIDESLVAVRYRPFDRGKKRWISYGWLAFSRNEKEYYDLAQLNVGLSKDAIRVRFSLEGSATDDMNRFLTNVGRSKESFFQSLVELKGYYLTASNARIVNDVSELTFEDFNEIKNELIVPGCYFALGKEFYKDDPHIQSENFINIVIEIFRKLLPIYELAVP